MDGFTPADADDVDADSYTDDDVTAATDVTGDGFSQLLTKVLNLSKWLFA